MLMGLDGTEGGGQLIPIPVNYAIWNFHAWTRALRGFREDRAVVNV